MQRSDLWSMGEFYPSVQANESEAMVLLALGERCVFHGSSFLSLKQKIKKILHKLKHLKICQ